MKEIKIAIIGVGAIGSVLAAALLSKYPETILVGRKPGWEDELGSKGITISGAITCEATVRYYYSEIAALKDNQPSLVFLATKRSTWRGFWKN